MTPNCSSYAATRTRWMGDPAALPPHYWAAVRKRMVWSLVYTLTRLEREGKVLERNEMQLKLRVVDWPAELVAELAETGSGWTGNERQGT